MTTNANPSRTTARFAASTVPTDGLWLITDRTDQIIVTRVKGRQAARDLAAMLSAIDPTVRPDDDVPVPLNLRDTKRAVKAAARKAAKAEAAPKAEAKPATVRASHADCDHASTKLARAICRRERAKI